MSEPEQGQRPEPVMDCTGAWVTPPTEALPCRDIWNVNVPLPDGVNTHVLCRCITREALIEIIRVLIAANSGGPRKIVIEVIND